MAIKLSREKYTVLKNGFYFIYLFYKTFSFQGNKIFKQEKRVSSIRLSVFTCNVAEIELKPGEGKVSALSISCSSFVLAFQNSILFMVSLQEYFKATSSFGGLKLNHIICNTILLYTCKLQYFTIL